jgi:hypothetical protein
VPKFADKVQRHISKGWRKEAEHLGQFFNIIRNGNTVATNLLIQIRRWAGLPDVEMEPNSYIYRIRCDRARFLIGDQIIGTEGATAYQNTTVLERYTIVAMRIMQENIGVRTDTACTIYRPIQMSMAGNVAPIYNIETILNAQILAMDPGTNTWAFYPQPAPSNFLTTIWMGLTFGRLRDYIDPQPVPLSTHATGWMATSGLINGWTPRESDMILDPVGNWYRVDRPYYQFEASFVNQLHATRVRP